MSLNTVLQDIFIVWVISFFVFISACFLQFSADVLFDQPSSFANDKIKVKIDHILEPVANWLGIICIIFLAVLGFTFILCIITNMIFQRV